MGGILSAILSRSGLPGGGCIEEVDFAFSVFLCASCRCLCRIGFRAFGDTTNGDDGETKALAVANDSNT